MPEISRKINLQFSDTVALLIVLALFLGIFVYHAYVVIALTILLVKVSSLTSSIPELPEEITTTLLCSI